MSNPSHRFFGRTLVRSGDSGRDRLLAADSGLTRIFEVSKIDKEKRTVELSFSSEIEYKRWSDCIEVLSHDDGAVELTRLNSSANLLFNHDPDKVLGVVESAKIEGRKGRAVVRFGSSSRATEVWKDVEEGILRNVSVGYRITECVLKERRDGVEVYVATKWEPYEISIVTVPADPTIGIGRTLNAEKKPNFERNYQVMNLENLIAMLKKRGVNVPEGITLEQATALLERSITVNEPAPDHRRLIEDERARVRSINEIGARFGEAEFAREFANSGKSVDEFNRELLEKVNKRQAELAKSGTIGLSNAEAKQFSILKLVRAMVDPTSRSAQEEAAFEFEACEAAAKTMHRSSSKGGLFIPVDVLMKRGTDVIGITDATGYTGTIGKAVETKLQTQSFMDLLRNATLAMQLGTKLGGLVGNLDFPEKATGTSGYWLGEDADLTQSDMTLGNQTLSPKTVGGFVEITRAALRQPSMDIEQLVRADLATAIGHTIDTAFWYGAGTAAPIGLKKRIVDATGNVKDLAGTQPTFAELVDMESLVAADNALTDNVAYVTNSAFRGYAKQTLKTASISGYIWEPGNTVNGTRCLISNAITSGEVFYGDFSKALIGMWGGLEILTDPYTNSKKGRVRITAFQDTNFIFRQPAYFAFAVKPTT